MPTKRIIVADDESHMTFILSFKLRQVGIDVATASDGEEAYALACAQQPDLIVADFQMPRMSGLEMATQLRQNPKTAQIPVLMVTARGHRIDEAELAKTNIRQVLAKPFSARELLNWIEKILGPISEQNGGCELDAA
ncbi:MAG TPA: response regulator [Tepidisphaeraceae bacterium]|nr:response regulator [Tepidisphaeraceae bacterium]